MKELLRQARGITNEMLEYPVKKASCFMRAITLIVGDSLTEDQKNKLAKGLEACARCSCNDHSMCAQWCRDIAEMQGKEETVIFCKALDSNGEVRLARVCISGTDCSGIATT